MQDGFNGAGIEAIINWLIGGARSAQAPEAVLDELCERLVACGIPLSRAGVFVSTLHPDVFGRSFIWKRGIGVAVGEADYTIPETKEFQTSPLHTVVRTAESVRHRMSETPVGLSIVLDDIRAQGVTDYVAYPLIATDGSVDTASWSTDAPSGFSDTDIRNIERIVPALARVAEVRALRRTATTLLNTYVGHRTGERILAGQIRRGHTDMLHAAIWLSDLRGFTAISDRAPPIIVVDLLNRYFDCQVPAINAHGGEVLKFMGDGLLAIFPVAEGGGDEAVVCANALAAAREARQAVRELRYSLLGGPTETVNFGLALHLGNVLYGNIGGANRLDFTCIGPAVNLAARMEKLTAPLKRTIVGSANFAQYAPDDWQDIGEFAVAGFARAQRVFGLKDEAGAAADVEGGTAG
jgi:adenylate cyclase